MSKRIPIVRAKEIAKKYEYDQVIILARKVGEKSSATTYGKNRENCNIAWKIGKVFLDLDDGNLKLVKAEEMR